MRHKSIRKVTLLCFAWYETEMDFQRTRALSSDSELFEETREEWLDIVEPQIFELEKQGYSIARVPIRPDDWVKWCQENGKPLDGSSRSEYVSFLPSE